MRIRITLSVNFKKSNTMGKFVIKKTVKGEWMFNLKAVNGQIILTSEGYTTKAACDNGIESVRKNSPEDGRYERKTAKDGSPYFNLKASNGQVIGKSEMYNSTASMENGIKSVKENGPGALVVEE